MTLFTNASSIQRNLVLVLALMALLIGSFVYIAPPVLASQPVVVAIATGGSHSLALMEDGTIWAWGGNDCGQLGDGSTIDRCYPVQVKDTSGTGFLKDIQDISAGGQHSLALKKDGTVWAWGENYAGQLGNGSHGLSLLPVQVKNTDGSQYLENIHRISAGAHQSFALDKEGRTWGWGNNSCGQLGDGTTEFRSLPIKLQGLADIAQIATASERTLALKTDGSVWAWGNGNLGTGVSSSLTPLQVKGPEGSGYLSGITMIISQYSSAAVNENNEVYLLGPHPQKLEGLHNICAISHYSYEIMALNTDGMVLWKNPSYYEPIEGLSTIVAIAGGYAHCLALDTEGVVWAWGNNDLGQLGNGTVENSSIPVKVEFGFYDDINPEIVATNPEANSSGIALDTIISVMFSEPIKPGNTYSAIQLLDENGNAVTLRQNIITENTLFLEPLNDFIHGKQYTVKIPAGAVSDLANNPLEKDKVFSFIAGLDIAVSDIKFSNPSLLLTVDSPPLVLEFTIAPDNASNKDVLWSSSNPEIASLDKNGTVTIHAIGSIIITVTTVDGGFSDECLLTVEESVAIEGITLNFPSLDLGIGQKRILRAEVTPVNASIPKLYWSSNNHNIVEVDDKGQITASAPGKATITVTTENGEFTAACHCTVSDMLVDFPDANLKAAVRQSIGKATGDIKQSDLLQVRSLSVFNMGVKNLEGLQYLKNITSLDLYGSQIEDLSPISSLCDLSRLDITHSNIKDLSPIEGLTELRSISLAYNQIENIEPLANLLKLERLDLNGNQLREIASLITNINNGGFQSGNDRYIDLQYNYLDINEQVTANNIQALLDNGIRVFFSPQRQIPEPQKITAVSIVIDNYPGASPQTGLNDAEIVFETAVAPGITRFLALYDPAQIPAEIGPVRSARFNLIQIASGYPGAFWHCGGSVDALNYLNHASLMDFDEIYGSGNYFFRKSERPMPHNLFTNKEMILQGIQAKQGQLTAFTGLPTGKMTGGSPSTEVAVNFPDKTDNTVFKWNPVSHKYQRYEKDRLCVLADGTPITASNVMVLAMPHQKYYDAAAHESVIQAEVTGEGPATFYRDGLMWEGRWRKGNPASEFEFTVDSEKMKFSSGTSWILITELPAITGTDPRIGEHSVELSPTLYAYLSGPLKPGNDFEKISLTDGEGDKIAITKELRDDLLIIRPQSPLAYYRYYILTIPAASLIGPSGQNLGEDTVIYFLTRGEYDYKLGLGKGWNLASLPRPAQLIDLPEKYVEALLAYAWRGGKMVWITEPDEVLQELNNPASAVFIKTQLPTSLILQWVDPPDPSHTFATKELARGWNLIGSSSLTNLKYNLASLRFDNGQGLTSVYNPRIFNSVKTITNPVTWYQQLIDISEWYRDDMMSPWDGYWVYLRGANQQYSIPINYSSFYNYPMIEHEPVRPPLHKGGGGSDMEGEGK